MEIITVPINAGETKVLHVAGEYFEVIDAVDPVDVFLYHPSGGQSSAIQALAGVYLRIGYKEVQIKSQTAQTLRVMVAEKEGGTRRQSGSVVVANTPNVEVINIPHVVVDTLPAVSISDAKNSAFTNAAATVGTTSGQLLAARASRRYLLVQNNSDTATIFVRLDGTAATNTTGVKLAPGASLELAAWCPTGAITAISDTAGTPVVVVEG